MSARATWTGGALASVEHTAKAITWSVVAVIPAEPKAVHEVAAVDPSASIAPVASDG